MQVPSNFRRASSMLAAAAPALPTADESPPTPVSAPIGKVADVWQPTAPSSPTVAQRLGLKEPVTKRSSFYTIGKVLGQGASAMVHRSQRPNGVYVAVKSGSGAHLKKGYTNEVEMRAYLKSQSGASTSHRNIIELHEVYHDADTGKSFMVFEWAQYGTLSGVLKNNRGELTEATARVMTRMIVEGVSFLHQHGVAHRDLKPDNILACVAGDATGSETDPLFVLKLADFGSASWPDGHGGQQRSDIAGGTIAYLSPERARSQEATHLPSDVWSVGAILFEILLEERLVDTLKGPGGHGLGLILRIGALQERPAIPETLSGAGKPALSPEGRQMLEGLLAVDPQQRLTLEDPFAHPWFQDRTPKI